MREWSAKAQRQEPGTEASTPVNSRRHALGAIVGLGVSALGRPGLPALGGAGLGALSALGLSACGAFDRLPIRPPDAPYVTTKEASVEAMLRLAKVGPNDLVYDLGCGDGRIPIMAAAKFGARGVGVELDAELVRLGRDNARKAGVADRVEFRLEDLFKTDVRPATVVALFLLPEMMEKLQYSLREQLRPGARVVSHQFGWGSGWLPDRTVRAGDATIHLWTIKR